jgi:hypothetical protein
VEGTYEVEKWKNKKKMNLGAEKRDFPAKRQQAPAKGEMSATLIQLCFINKYLTPKYILLVRKWFLL